eukprot:946718-Amphidinium_carterae.1
MAPRWSCGTARRGCQRMQECQVGLASSRLARSPSTSLCSRDERSVDALRVCQSFEKGQRDSGKNLLRGE